MRGKLTALFCERAAKDGRFADGNNLYLVVDGKSKYWAFRYDRKGKDTWMGLSAPFPAVGISEARDLRDAQKRLQREGKDPLDVKHAAKASAKAVKSFRSVADAYMKTHAKGWTPATLDQWANSLRDYVYPIIGQDRAVDAIDTAMVMKCIGPHWSTRTETMSRVRRRIEAVLDAAKVQGFRDGENPARLKGHLDNLLPKVAKVAPVVAHPAMGGVMSPPSCRAFASGRPSRLGLWSSASCAPHGRARSWSPNGPNSISTKRRGRSRPRR